MRRSVSRQEIPASIRMLVPELERTAVLPREPDASTVIRTMERRIVEKPVDTRVIILVLIKSAATLLAQPSSIHHLHKQRARTVFGIAKTVVQNAHDVETDIQANEVGKGQWTHWMCHSQFEYFVDGLWSRHTFHHRVHRLV